MLYHHTSGNRDYATEKWARCDLSHQVAQEGETGRDRRDETSVCIDGFISHELQELRKRKLFWSDYGRLKKKKQCSLARFFLILGRHTSHKWLIILDFRTGMNMNSCQLARYLLLVVKVMMVRYLETEKEATDPLRINLPNNLNMAQHTRFFIQPTSPWVPTKLLPSDWDVKWIAYPYFYWIGS